MTLQEVFRRGRRARDESAERAALLQPQATRSAWLLALIIALACGCATSGGTPTPSICAQFDSFYAHSGFEVPLTITGKATVNANQYQIRGIIRAEFHPSGDVYLDFSSSVLFGSQIEDFFFSLVSDTLRIVDRERGQIYEGERAAEFLREALAMDFDVVHMLKRAAGGRPPCRDLDELRARTGQRGEFRFEGRHDDGDFRVRFSGPGQRLDSAEWPVAGDGGVPDRLIADYRWAESPDPQLRRIVMRLETREWRCRITATD